MLNNTKLRHFWKQIVSWAPIHARKTFIILAPGLKWHSCSALDSGNLTCSRDKLLSTGTAQTWLCPWCMSVSQCLAEFISLEFLVDRQKPSHLVFAEIALKCQLLLGTDSIPTLLMHHQVGRSPFLKNSQSQYWKPPNFFKTLTWD